MNYLTEAMITPFSNDAFIETFRIHFGEEGMPIDKESIMKLYKLSVGSLRWLRHFIPTDSKKEYLSLFKDDVSVYLDLGYTKDDAIDMFLRLYQGNKKRMVDKIVANCQGKVL
jgi:hypothetical protein